MKKDGIVYSTAGGRMCPGCGRPIAECVCRKASPPVVAGDVVVRVLADSLGQWESADDLGSQSHEVNQGQDIDPLVFAAEPDSDLPVLCKDLRADHHLDPLRLAMPAGFGTAARRRTGRR
jgi:hypothetical protein